MTGSAGLYEALLYGSIAVFALMVGVYLRSGRASMFHPATVYLAFHFITFVIRPFFALYNNYDLIYSVYDFNPTWDEKITVVLAANLGLVLFTLAVLAFGNAPARIEDVPESQLRNFVKPLLLTCIVVGIPGILSVRSDIAGAFGEQRVFDAATGVTINTTSNGYFAEAQLMLATLTGLIAYIFRFRWWSLLPLLVFVMFRAGIGGRGPFISAMFFFILMYLYHRRRRWLTLQTLLVSGAALALFRVVGDDRGAAIRTFLGYAPTDYNVEKMRFLESMDWANLEFFEYLVHVVPARTGRFDYFVSFLQIVTEPVPRAFWPGKPIGAPVKLFNLFDYGNPVGMTMSLPGAGWFELGWAGIAIICVAFAWIYGKAYNKFMHAPQSHFGAMLYCAFAASSIVAFRDGSIITIMKQSLFYLAPVVIMYGFSKALGIPVRPKVADGQLAVAVPVVPAQQSPRERRKARMAPVSGRERRRARTLAT